MMAGGFAGEMDIFSRSSSVMMPPLFLSLNVRLIAVGCLRNLELVGFFTGTNFATLSIPSDELPEPSSMAIS